MNFEPDDEQRQLRDSLRRLLEVEGGFGQRRRAVGTEAGWSRELWRSICGLGLAAMPLPTEHGGFGMPPITLLPVLQELGRSLALVPFLSSTVLASSAVGRAGSATQRGHWLPGLADGSRRLAWAHDEAPARHRGIWLQTKARFDGLRWRLDGRKHNVLYGTDADAWVVSARVAGAPGDAHGLALFLVAPGEGVRCAARRLIDDTPAAEIELQGAWAEPLGDASDHAAALAALCATQEAGLAAVCAEAAGVAESAFAFTTAYVRERRQFGRAIGDNQAVRHRVAEMQVALDMVRSAAMAALLALDIDDGGRRRDELSRAKMLVGRHATFVAQQAIQLHGGIGMTVEYPVGHCLRRLGVIEQSFGDAPSHAARLGAALAAAA